MINNNNNNNNNIIIIIFHNNFDLKKMKKLIIKCFIMLSWKLNVNTFLNNISLLGIVYIATTAALRISQG